MTQNRRDFRRLHGLWLTLFLWGMLPATHAGILTVQEQESALPEGWAQAIRALLLQTPALDGLMYKWRPSTGQWELERPALG